MSRMSLSFDGWPPHYIANMYIAILEWMKRCPEMEGTCVWEQMRDMKSIAEQAFKERRG